MSEPKTILKPVEQIAGLNRPHWAFWCPGCKCGHVVWLDGPTKWSFNGNTEKPTFSPSILNQNELGRCHMFVENGMIKFCGDCSHELAGKNVQMEAF